MLYLRFVRLCLGEREARTFREAKHFLHFIFRSEMLGTIVVRMLSSFVEKERDQES